MLAQTRRLHLAVPPAGGTPFMTDAAPGDPNLTYFRAQDNGSGIIVVEKFLPGIAGGVWQPVSDYGCQVCKDRGWTLDQTAFDTGAEAFQVVICAQCQPQEKSDKLESKRASVASDALAALKPFLT